MLTTDCPLCGHTATLDPELTTLDCDACGIAVEIATDPVPADLAVAA